MISTKWQTSNPSFHFPTETLNTLTHTHTHVHARIRTYTHTNKLAKIMLQGQWEKVKGLPATKSTPSQENATFKMVGNSVLVSFALVPPPPGSVLVWKR